MVAMHLRSNLEALHEPGRPRSCAPLFTLEKAFRTAEHIAQQSRNQKQFKPRNTPNTRKGEKPQIGILRPHKKFGRNYFIHRPNPDRFSRARPPGVRAVRGFEDMLSRCIWTQTVRPPGPES